MDKYEFNIKVEQMKKQANLGDYQTAMKIADTIDWRRVQNVSLLSLVSDIYEKNQEFGEAKEILLLAFEKAPIGKGLLYKLTKLAINDNSVEEAEAYYREFYDLAPEDPRQYILRYLILKAKGAPTDQLIHSLETYTHTELDEKWMYELAELYHEAGRSDDCIRMCDNIMLMFGLGKYVDKAIELKTEKEGRPLTQYQQGLVDNRDHYEEKLKEVAEEYGTMEEAGPEEEYNEDLKLPDQGDGAPRVREEDGTAAASGPEEPHDEMDDEIAAHLREIEAEEKLAKEVSNIKPSLQEEPDSSHTKVFTGVGHPGGIGTGAAMAAAAESLGNTQAIKIEEDKEPELPKPAVPETASEMLKDLPADDDGGEIKAESAAAPEEVNTVPKEAEAGGTAAPADDLELEDLDKIGEIKTPGSFNCVVQGKTPEEGFTAAIARLKEIHAATGVKNQVAKIKAAKLNERGVLASAEKIRGRDLIIEEAGDLTDKSISELLTVISEDNGKRTILLIDNPLQVGKLTASHPALADAFHAEPREKTDTQTFEAVDMSGAALRKAAPVTAAVSKAALPAQETPVSGAALPTEPVNRGAQVPLGTGAQAPLGAGAQASLGTGAQVPLGAGAQVPLVAGAQAARSTTAPAMIKQASPDTPRAKTMPARTEEPEVSEEERAFEEEELDIDEFAHYASDYAKKIDCSISGKSMLALYERVEIMEEDGIRLTRKNAEALIEEAADKAEKPPLFKKLFSPKYDRDGLLILKEEDFIS